MWTHAITHSCECVLDADRRGKGCASHQANATRGKPNVSQTEKLEESIIDGLGPGSITDENGGLEIEIEMLDTVDQDGIERELQELLDNVRAALPVEEFHMDDELVKNNLEELLLILIGLHEETHGKELMSDVAWLTDVQLSPGTIYPVLHSLEEDDRLSVHKKVRTKAYKIDDEDQVTADLERSMIQHLCLGMLQYAFLSKFRR